MVKQIALKNVGNTDVFEAEFNDGLNIIYTNDGETLAYALGYITNNFPLCRAFPVRLSASSKIYAEVKLDQPLVFDTDTNADREKISSLFSQSREEDDFCFYKSGKFKNSKVRLLEYKDHEYFYPQKRFLMLTDGCCSVRSFRAYLNQYIKGFKPQKLNPSKDYFLNLSDEGEFFVSCENKSEIFLSASEAALFDFFCFLNVVEFGEGFEAIKDFNRTKKPIIITELFERMDESIPKSHIIKRLKRLNRQVFLIERK